MTTSFNRSIPVLLAAVAALALPLPAHAAGPSPATCGSGEAKRFCEVDGPVGARPLAVGNCPAGHHCVYYREFNTWSHNYFNGDQDFTDDRFDTANSASGLGRNEIVNDNVWAAANSTTNNRESHYYYNVNPSTSSRLVFCVNPDHQVLLPADDGVRGNGEGKRDEVSALIIRPRTPVSCF